MTRYLENLNNKLKALFIVITIVFSVSASYLLFVFITEHPIMDAHAADRMIVSVSPSSTSGTVPFSVWYTVSASPRLGFVSPIRWYIHCETGSPDFDIQTSGGATKTFKCNYDAGQFGNTPGTYTVHFRANVFELGYNCSSPWCDSTGVDTTVTVPSSAPPPPPATKPPAGSFDIANCDELTGWAYDPDIPNQSINVHMYVNNVFFTALSTDLLRQDVNNALGITGNHGYGIFVPKSLKDNTPKEIKFYAIDNGSDGNPLLVGSPKTITCASNDAQFISQSVPTKMTPGQTSQVTVVMKNTGTTNWTNATNYKLGSQNPANNLTWGGRIYLTGSEVIVPGGQKTFTFNITAPTVPGIYNFQWRMLEELVEWFGDFTPNLQIEVANNAPIGWLDIANCNFIAGWAVDMDTPNSSIDVHIYIDGLAGAGGSFLAKTTTDVLRQGVNDALGITGNHGYRIPIPASLIDGSTHTIYAYGIDSGGVNPLLSGTPKILDTAACLPSVSNINVIQPDYCTSGPAAIISWTYTGNPAQSAYRVVIREGNGTPVLGSGKVLSGSNAFFTGQGKLSFNTSYNARVEVWNSNDVRSGLSGPISFTTPLHAFPQVNFSWDPQSIIPGEDIQFTDESVVVTNPGAWLWDFGDGNLSADQNPVHKYDIDGTKTVSFTVTDTEGLSCSSVQELGVKKTPPEWIEVLPQ